jgi:hypothetical protein
MTKNFKKLEGLAIGIGHAKVIQPILTNNLQ